MNAMKKILMAAMLTAAATTVFAQQTPLPANPGRQYNDDMGIDNETPSGRGGVLSEKKREEIRKKIEAVRIWRLTEALKLDADTGARLSSLLSSMDLKRKEIMKDYTQAMKELRVYVKAAKPDEAKIKAVLETIDQKHHEMQAIRDQELKSLKDMLTVEQQARFRLFQQEFGREMRNMFSNARGGGPAKGGIGPGGGRGQSPRPGMGGPMPGSPARPQDQ